MYFYPWNQWQILPEKSLIRKFRLLRTLYTIQYSHSYDKSNLDSRLIRTTPPNISFYLPTYLKRSWSDPTSNQLLFYLLISPPRFSRQRNSIPRGPVGSARGERPSQLRVLSPRRFLSFFKYRRS